MQELVKLTDFLDNNPYNISCLSFNFKKYDKELGIWYNDYYGAYELEVIDLRDWFIESAEVREDGYVVINCILKEE